MANINYTKRIDALRAMDIIINSLNDETFLDEWLSLGIEDQCTDYDPYTDNETFRDIMTLFCEIMHNATGERAALWVDGVTSE